MKKLSLAFAIGAVAIPNAAVAHDTTVGFGTRGACEASNAAQSNAEKDWLLQIGMEFFSTEGDVSSFLTRAFTCDRNVDGQYYLTDHIEDVLASDWFAQRKH